jgi:hypothetical protein
LFLITVPTILYADFLPRNEMCLYSSYTVVYHTSAVYTEQQVRIFVTKKCIPWTEQKDCVLAGASQISRVRIQLKATV